MPVTSRASSLRAEVLDAGHRIVADMREFIPLLAKFDRSGEWMADGAVSCAQWIADALDIEVCTAREWLRIGRKLEQLDHLGARFADGSLSYSKVRALTRVATSDNQHALAELARQTPASRLAGAVATWLNQHETTDQTEARHRRHTWLGWRHEPDGMTTATARLAPLAFARFQAAIDTRLMMTRHAPADAWPSIAQQRADALIALVTHDGEMTTHEVVLHVRGDGCTLDDGTPIPNSVVERIAPLAFVRALIHDADRRPINASGRQRHPTTRQRRVVRERDRRCVDCGSTDLLSYDHVPDYRHSRRTVVDELAPRCPVCHHRRHQTAGDS